MLVISQKKGQKIHIGRDITITIVDAKPGKVKIGIEAPSAIPIEREISDKHQENNKVKLEIKNISNT